MTSRTPATKERIWEMQRDRKEKRRKIERERVREGGEGKKGRISKQKEKNRLDLSLLVRGPAAGCN